nr:MAG TPA: hypothetical protein [Caudoviricetes sp.]
MIKHPFKRKNISLRVRRVANFAIFPLSGARYFHYLREKITHYATGRRQRIT